MQAKSKFWICRRSSKNSRLSTQDYWIEKGAVVLSSTYCVKLKYRVQFKSQNMWSTPSLITSIKNAVEIVVFKMGDIMTHKEMWWDYCYRYFGIWIEFFLSLPCCYYCLQYRQDDLAFKFHSTGIRKYGTDCSDSYCNARIVYTPNQLVDALFEEWNADGLFIDSWIRKLSVCGNYMHLPLKIATQYQILKCDYFLIFNFSTNLRCFSSHFSGY